MASVLSDSAFYGTFGFKSVKFPIYFITPCFATLVTATIKGNNHRCKRRSSLWMDPHCSMMQEKSWPLCKTTSSSLWHQLLRWEGYEPWWKPVFSHLLLRHHRHQLNVLQNKQKKMFYSEKKAICFTCLCLRYVFLDSSLRFSPKLHSVEKRGDDHIAVLADSN